MAGHLWRIENFLIRPTSSTWWSYAGPTGLESDHRQARSSRSRRRRNFCIWLIAFRLTRWNIINLVLFECCERIFLTNALKCRQFWGSSPNIFWFDPCEMPIKFQYQIKSSRNRLHEIKIKTKSELFFTSFTGCVLCRYRRIPDSNRTDFRTMASLQLRIHRPSFASSSGGRISRSVWRNDANQFRRSSKRHVDVRCQRRHLDRRQWRIRPSVQVTLEFILFLIKKRLKLVTQTLLWVVVLK